MPSPERDNKGIAIPPMSCDKELHNYLTKLYVAQLDGNPLPKSEAIYDQICFLVGSNSRNYLTPVRKFKKFKLNDL